MNTPVLADLLIGCVLDPELLRRVQESPETVLTNYTLSDEAREILTNPDQRMFQLLAMVAQEQSQGRDLASMDTTPEEDDALSTTSSPPPDSIAPTPLTESHLVLRLVPYVQSTATSDDTAATHIQVTYAAQIDPLHAGMPYEELPEIPAAAVPGQPLPALSVVVSVQPLVWSDEQGNQQMTFCINSQLPPEGAPTPTEDVAPLKLTPWQHDVDSDAVKSAAKRVREADSDTQYDRLLELIKLVVAPIR